MLRWRAATREIAEPRRLVGINSSAALRAFFVPGECAELSARERPCLSAGVWRGGTQSSICVCVGCGCVAAFPVPARRRAQCCAWALLGGCIVVESGGGVRSFLQRRALYVSSRGRRVQNSSAQESRGGLSFDTYLGPPRPHPRAHAVSHRPTLHAASEQRTARATESNQTHKLLVGNDASTTS